MWPFKAKTYEMPKGNVENWTRRDVRQWLKHAGFKPLRDCFLLVDGKALLTMDAAYVEHLTKNPSAARAVAAAIERLKVIKQAPDMRLSTAPSTPSPLAASPCATPAGAATPAAEDSGSILGTMHPGSGMSTMPTQAPSPELDATRPPPPSPANMESATPPPHPGLLVKALHSSRPEAAAFLKSLGGLGEGLERALTAPSSSRAAGEQQQEAVIVLLLSPFVGAAHELHTAAQSVQAISSSAAKLQAMAQDAVRIIDVAGLNGQAVSGKALEVLSAAMEDGTKLLKGLSTSGFLLRVVCNERLREELTAVHDAMVDALQAEGLLQLPVARRIQRGNYADTSRLARRMLKQLGRGSLSDGIMHLRSNTSAAVTDLHEFASLLEASSEAVAAELQQLSSAALDVFSFYSGYCDPLPVAAKAQPDDVSTNVFCHYDINSSGAIELQELQAMLQDLGMLDGKDVQSAQQLVCSSLVLADRDGDGALSLEEFARFYGSLVMGKARQQLRATMGLKTEEELRHVFVAFASFGSRALVAELDAVKLVKLVREAGLLGGPMTSVAVDLMFAHAKSRGARRVTFEQFITVLAGIAEKKGCPLQQVVQQVIACKGPVAAGTSPQAVRLHDDRSTYSGTSAHGTPASADRRDASSVRDRSDTESLQSWKPASTPSRRITARGDAGTPQSAGASPLPPQASLDLPRGSGTPSDTSKAARTPKATAAGSLKAPDSAGRTPWSAPSQPRTAAGQDDTTPVKERLHQVFSSYATFGTGQAGSSAGSGLAKAPELDSSRFAKLVREAGLLDKAFDLTSADLVFAKVKPRGQHKMGFREFNAALELVAAAKGCGPEELRCMVAAAGKPQHSKLAGSDSLRQMSRRGAQSTKA